ncbi:MAG TPA: sigma factor [Polyangiaceae bacterium]
MNETADVTLDHLMARLAEGDRAAFTPVFERLWPPILRLCTAMLKNEADAADAAQLALEKVLTRASDYDPDRPALPWAFAIASWECRTLMRKRARRREAPESAAAELPSPDADVDYAERELLAAAATTLGTLSESDRETLTATFWNEAASVGGATLRKRRERALGRLRNAFKRLYGID